MVANLSKVGNPLKALFEVIKVQNRKLRNIEYHNDRLNHSLYKVFGIKKPIYLEQIINIPKELNNQIYKCRVIYSGKIEMIEFEPYSPKIIKSLKIVVCNDIDYNHKYFDRSRINELYEQRGDCDDILIIKNGFVTDTSYANIIFWNGKSWITPTYPLLPGTKRKKLMEEKEIIEKEIKVGDLQSFEKARIINAMIELEESPDIKKII